MHPVIAKTLGGLSLNYYLRQFVFGLIFPALFLLMQSQTTQPTSIGMIVFLLVSSLLYPYSRFVYETNNNAVMLGMRYFHCAGRSDVFVFLS